MDYLMLVSAVVLLAFSFSLNKVYQKSAGVSPGAGFKFNAMGGLFSAIIFFVLNGFKFAVTPYSVVMAAAGNILVMLYTVIGFRLMKSGSMALYMLFLMTGGMIIPYVWGLLFLNEPFSLLRTFGLAIIILGVAAANYSREKINVKQLSMYMAVFFINGFVSVILKHHQIEKVFAAVNTNEYIILGGISKFILGGILYFVFRDKQDEVRYNFGFGKLILITAGAALISGASSRMQLLGAVTLPATVLYPFITGGTIIFTSLAGRVFFKEKLSKRLIAGIALCFMGTVMFL